MLKMSSSDSNTGLQTLPPLVNGIVNDALLHVSPHVNQMSLRVVHILDFLSGRHVAALRPRFCSQLGLGLGCLTCSVCRCTVLRKDEELARHLTYGWQQLL